MRLSSRIEARRVALGIAACLGIAGAAVVAYATAYGPSAGSDSVAYVVSAQNLLSGSGLGLVNASGSFSPLYPHFPPAYPLTLAAGGLLASDLIAVARWIDVAAFGLLVSMVGVGSILLSGKPGLGVSLSIVALTSTALVRQFSSAMSEPLFILLSTLGLLLLAAHLVHSRSESLAGAAAALGLASVTRYVGVAFIAAGGLSILGLAQEGWSRRFRRALALSLASLAPLLVWLWLINTGGLQLSPRALVLSVSDVWSALTEFRRGVVMSSWSFSALLGLGAGSYDSRKTLLLVGGAVWLLLLTLGLKPDRQEDHLRRNERRPLVILTVVPALFATAYLVTLGVAFVFSRPQPDINARMLSPIILPLWLSWISVWLLVSERYAVVSWLKIVPYLMVVLSAAGSLTSYVEHVTEMHREGQGYTSRSWRTSAAIQAALRLPDDIALISNDSAALLFLAHRPAYDIPELVTRQKQDVFQMFGDDRQDATERIFREGGAALILFANARGQFMNLYGDRGEARLEALTTGLEVYQETPDGTIYIYPR